MNIPENSALKLFIFIALTVTGLSYVNAYDGDVDFSAPYVTVDPETGKLVTVDPKTQTKTPHTSPGNASTSGTDNNGNPPATTGVMAQSPAGSSEDTSPVSGGTGPGLTVLIGLLLAGFVVAYIYRNKIGRDDGETAGKQE